MYFDVWQYITCSDCAVYCVAPQNTELTIPALLVAHLVLPLHCRNSSKIQLKYRVEKSKLDTPNKQIHDRSLNKYMGSLT
jgi:hypothetical protein